MPKHINKYFLSLPTPQGNWSYYEVDPSRLQLDQMRELYTKDHSGREPKSTYIKVLGALEHLSAHTDATPVIDALHEVCESMALTFEGMGEEGINVRDEYVRNVRLLIPVISEISAGHTQHASDLIRDFVYALFSDGVQLATKLDNLTSHVSGMQVGVDALKDAYENTDSQVKNVYLDWAVQCLEFLKLLAVIEEFELEIQIMDEEVAFFNAQCNTSHGHSPVYKKAIDFFDGDVTEGSEGFIDQAYLFSRRTGEEPDVENSIKSAIQIARNMMSACDNAFSVLYRPWHTLKSSLTKFQRDAMEKRDRYSEALSGMYNYLKDKETTYGRKSLNAILGEDTISSQQLETLYQKLDDPKWDPKRCKERQTKDINGLLIALSIEPRMPSKYTDKASTALDLLEKCEAKLNSKTESRSVSHTTRTTKNDSVAVVPRAFPSVATVIGSMRKTEIPHAQVVSSSQSNDANMIETLYELVQCVGYVLTCKIPFLARSNIRAMLDIVEILGVVHETDLKKRFGADVEKRSLKDREKVNDSSVVITRFRESRSVWIDYFDVKKPLMRLKMTQHAGQSAYSLLQKYGLTESQIRDVHTAKRSAGRAEYEARKRAS